MTLAAYAALDAETDRRNDLRRAYLELRADGYLANEALKNARILTTFDASPAQLMWEPSYEDYDCSYLDTWGLSDSEVRRLRSELYEQIDRDGIWILTSKIPCKCGSWKIVDSISGLIGQDGAGYEFCLMQSALDAL